MDKEEQTLKQRFGNKAPFKVPEGYFDDFADKFMDKLPEQKARTVSMRPRWHRYRPAMLAAACICGAIMSLSIYLHTSRPSNEPMAKTHIEISANNTIDQMADYTMLDNEDIYASLVDNQ
ncbi:MAG: hypothetical protein LKG25_03625 [Prevotella sp.]|jgi:hypothetical protein|nr:hypothetical protein [Prevotella sp.]MCI1281668.1 hypothetical protein [Prevotella sp.]